MNFDITLFMIIIAWVGFGYSFLVLAVSNFIWYVLMNNMQRTLHTKATGKETILFITTSIFLYVFYFGGTTG